MLDIIFFALLAGFILYRLINTLGETDEEQNKFRKKDMKFVGGKDVFIKAEGNIYSHEMQQNIEKIKQIDKYFDAEQFLEGARFAFMKIIHAMNNNKTDLLEKLLTPAVYKSFLAEIERRKKEEDLSKVEILEILKAEIVKISLIGEQAYINVKFLSRQMYHDPQAKIDHDIEKMITTLENMIEESEDHWVFTRDLRSEDPTWFLAETVEDDEI